MSVSAKAWGLTKTATLPHYYFDLKKEKKNGDAGESSWTPATSLVLAMAEALKYVAEIGMANLIANASDVGAGDACPAAGELGLELFAKRPGSSVTAIQSPAGINSGAIVKGFKERFGAVIANGRSEV